MGSAYEFYNNLFDEDEYDMIAAIDSDSSDEEVVGHPRESKEEVLRNLKDGFPYNKGGPAQQYYWTSDDISQMADLLRQKNEQVRRQRKKRPRCIRGQNYRGDTSSNYLLNWVNSVRTGRRFESNPHIIRGEKLKHGQCSNHRLWEYVSEFLTCEFKYWMTVHKTNMSLPKSQRSKVRYPRVEDLIFRVNDDFTGGLWSQFYKYWEPFINELRLDICYL